MEPVNHCEWSYLTCFLMGEWWGGGSGTFAGQSYSAVISGESAQPGSQEQGSEALGMPLRGGLDDGSCTCGWDGRWLHIPADTALHQAAGVCVCVPKP
jgi:hypothetical protein